jgi:hypothetical protein
MAQESHLLYKNLMREKQQLPSFAGIEIIQLRRHKIKTNK